MAVTQVRIDSLEQPLAAVAYEPQARAHTAICAFLPLGEERKGCIRILHETGLTLAEQGIALLVFDYFGTGDSDGEFSQITPKTLLHDARAAREWLFLRQPQARQGMLCIRLGAVIAGEAALSKGLACDLAVLWQPVFDSAKWLKDARRRSAFRGTAYAAPDAANTSLDIDGCLYSPPLRKWLEQERKAADYAPVLRAPLAFDFAANLRQSLADEASALRGRAISLKMEPFWLETGVVEAAPLARETAAFFKPGNGHVQRL